MADALNGGSGRIVPIVLPRQHSTQSNPDEMSSGPEQFESNVDEHNSVEQEQTEQQSTKVVAAGRKTRSGAETTECLEIPCLNELGLYALPTEGDGNCLYYALSDQLYGDFSHAEEIRIRLADHISNNSEYFMSFIAAAGGTRRAPRRAAASGARYSSRSPSSASPVPPPSVHETEQSFNSKVAQSRKNGVWGGAEEIQACCQSFKRDVHVYTMYGVQTFRDVHAPDSEERDILHIAFHDFHHYSSVRHTEGPHTGMPAITKDRLRVPSGERPVVEMATPWKISAIQEGLGDKYDRDTIIEMLQQCRGNIDRAFCNLLGEEPSLPPQPPPSSSGPSGRAILRSKFHNSSRSSSPFSTASKRSAEDDDPENDNCNDNNNNDDDSDSEAPRSAQRRRRQRRRRILPQSREHKRRILPDVTVGIAFRDDRNDLVSLRLRVSPDEPGPASSKSSQQQQQQQQQPLSQPDLERADSGIGLEQDKPPSAPSSSGSGSGSAEASSSQTDSGNEQTKLRRSRRLIKGRNMAA